MLIYGALHNCFLHKSIKKQLCLVDFSALKLGNHQCLLLILGSPGNLRTLNLVEQHLKKKKRTEIKKKKKQRKSQTSLSNIPITFSDFLIIIILFKSRMCCGDLNLYMRKGGVHIRAGSNNPT